MAISRRTLPERKWASIRDCKPYAITSASFVAGFVSVIIVLAIVGVVGGALGRDDGEGTGGIVWEFVSTAATGLTVFFGAPMIFRPLGLTEVPVKSRSAVTTAG